MISVPSQWQVKKPQSFCQKCRWHIPPKQASTCDPLKSEWADYATVQASTCDPLKSEWADYATVQASTCDPLKSEWADYATVQASTCDPLKSEWADYATVQASTYDPLKFERADYATVQASSGNLSGNKLTHNSIWNAGPQSPQLAEPLWTDPGLKEWN